MVTGSGLDGQVGFAQESTYGTGVTPTRFIEFNSEDMKFDPTFQEPGGIRVGTKAKRASRLRVSRKAGSGSITLEHATLGMGLLWKNALASTVTTTTLVSGTAYKQIHTPGDFLGKSLTFQVGRPQPSDGVVKPFTYKGCKVTGWEFNLTDSNTPTLQLTFDAQDEDTTTALATASFLANSTTYDFSQASLKLGGTATTATGETTISGGVAVSTVINSVSLSGDTPMANERYGVGNTGLKKEPLENDQPTWTGSLSAEFNKAELYDVFKANTSTAMQFDFTGGLIGGGNNFLLSFIYPSVRFKAASPNVSGFDIVSMDTDFEAYSDEINPVIQVKIVSTESTTI